MKHYHQLSLTILMLASAASAFAQQFARGADISWSTEMLADDKKFYNTDGQETAINALMKACGMNAIRLRVWVEPTLGGWCGTQDVVEKARAARDAGMDVMIDFHYSDFFADPSRQSIPAAWAGKSLTELAEMVSTHTSAVLKALKAEGITPKWVQLGNETRSGMLYSLYNSSSHAWNDATGITTGSTLAEKGGNWTNYATLSNAGYDAAKEVFPNVICISHLDTRSSDTDLNWWFDAFRKAGGKCDMIGLSHYPMGWNSSGEAQAQTNAIVRNDAFIALCEKLYKAYALPVMVVETGVYCEYVEGGKAVLQDLFAKCRKTQGVKGVFYWEPEQYNWWKPSIYTTIGWSNYNMCAFLNDGRPSAILDAFQPAPEDGDADGIHSVLQDKRDADLPVYDLWGRPSTQHTKGIVVSEGRKILR